MTIHYHGTPITPLEELYKLSGKFFCVSHASKHQVRHCHQIGQGVMLDNGAFSAWKSGKQTNWTEFYTWCDAWLDYPNTWAIPPDVINAGPEHQDKLLREWPHEKRKSGPVWHMDEPIARLCRLIDGGWSRVCIGSTSVFSLVLSCRWQDRMDETWNELARVFGITPPIHMLRGMACSGMRWPFQSVDSTDVARNHHIKKNARAMTDRWDGVQCPGTWKMTQEQGVLV